MRALEKELKEAVRDVEKHQQLSEIASQQAQALTSFRQQHGDELKELRGYCARLESRRYCSAALPPADFDEGELPRLREEVPVHAGEHQGESVGDPHSGDLEERDREVQTRQEMSALKKALRGMKNMVVPERRAVGGQGLGVGLDGKGEEEEDGTTACCARSRRSCRRRPARPSAPFARCSRRRTASSTSTRSASSSCSSTRRRPCITFN